MDYPKRLIKIGEKDQAIVKMIAKALADHGYAVTSPPGIFDKAFKSLLKLYQSQHFDTSGRPLEVDGEAGSMTWGALFGAETDVVANASIATAALGMAVTQLGVMEVPAGSNTGPQVNRYLASVDLHPGAYWCMAFVYWCFSQASQTGGASNPFPKTGHCLTAWNKVKAKSPQRIITRAQAIADPTLVKPGQVFIHDYGGGHGHTGFVRQSFGGPLRTVEGNSNSNGSSNGIGVFELNRRKLPDASLRGFIDFTA